MRNRALAVVGLVLGCLLVLPAVAGSTPTDDAGLPQISDALGTYDPQFLFEAQQEPLNSGPLRPASSRNACGGFTRYGGGFSTSLGSGWSYLAARKGPCRAADSNGGWGTGSRFYVEREAHGEFICRGRRTYGYGSDVWFRTSKGWSWSGGTSDARWNRSC